MPADFTAPLSFETPSAWYEWLSKHHATSRGVALKFAKKNSGHRSVTHAEALESALCHGWIDGQSKRIDDGYFMQRFTPRRPDSIWSRVNREKVLTLIERGLMQPAGHDAIAQAKANGRWEAAYEPPSTRSIPPDLETALHENSKAAAFFATLSGQNRYAILFRLQTAKKPETRASRLKRFVGMLERGETLH